MSTPVIKERRGKLIVNVDFSQKNVNLKYSLPNFWIQLIMFTKSII